MMLGRHDTDDTVTGLHTSHILAVAPLHRHRLLNPDNPVGHSGVLSSLLMFAQPSHLASAQKTWQHKNCFSHSKDAPGISPGQGSHLPLKSHRFNNEDRNT